MPPATVGVDIGGTKVSVARFASGELSGNFQEPTERASSAALVDQIVAAVERIREPGDAAVGVYGVLRYMDGESELAARLAALPQPEVSFNYLGQYAAAQPQEMPGWQSTGSMS